MGKPTMSGCLMSRVLFLGAGCALTSEEVDRLVDCPQTEHLPPGSTFRLVDLPA